MARLTAAQRRKLPKSDFALPPDSYPDEDRKHALAALSEVAQHGTPAQIAKVRAAVKRKYPNMKVSGK